MTRRDTIIIAVFVNVGLLAILFMMAVNTSDEKVTEQPQGSQIVLQTPEPTPVPLTPEAPVAMAATAEAPTIQPTQPASGDELDNVLKDYAANVPPQTIVLDDDNPDTIEKDMPPEPQPAEPAKPASPTAS